MESTPFPFRPFLLAPFLITLPHPVRFNPGLPQKKEAGILVGARIRRAIAGDGGGSNRRGSLSREDNPRFRVFDERYTEREWIQGRKFVQLFDESPDEERR